MVHLVVRGVQTVVRLWPVQLRLRRVICRLEQPELTQVEHIRTLQIAITVIKTKPPYWRFCFYNFSITTIAAE